MRRKKYDKKLLQLTLFVNFYSIIFIYRRKWSGRLMISSKKEENGFVYILNVISQYNSFRNNELIIKFILGGTSADLAFVGKTTIITRLKTSDIVTIPHALIPCKKLRKKYGLHLFIMPIMAYQKDLIYYNNLLGGTVSIDGITACYQYAIKKNIIKIEDIHRTIIAIILQMEPNTYIRNLKKLLTLMTNMMLMDPAAKQKAHHYLVLLESVRDNLKDKIDVHFYFDKYIARIKNILGAEISPFPADDKFRTEVLNQYPILFCSIADSKIHCDSTSERLYEDELSLKTVKLLFTPVQHVDRLRAKLQEIGFIEQIAVYGYALPDEMDNAEIEGQNANDEAAFLNALTVDELQVITNKHPMIISSKKIIEEKMINCLAAYLDGKATEHFFMADWLMKNANSITLTDMNKILSESANFSLYEILQSRAYNYKNYLPIVANIMSLDSLARLEDVLYLKALLELRQSLHYFHALFDFRNNFSYEELHQRIEPKQDLFVERNQYLYEYLARLQNLYTVWLKTQTSAENAENVYSRLAFVKAKYIDLLNEYSQSNRLNHSITQSELFQMINRGSKLNDRLIRR